MYKNIKIIPIIINTKLKKYKNIFFIILIFIIKEEKKELI